MTMSHICRRFLIAACVALANSQLSAPVLAQTTPTKITVFGQPSVNNDTVWMAVDRGFFEREGLSVTYRLFPSGTTALQSFQAGQGDIVVAGDLPTLQYFFNAKKKFQVLAAMERDSKGYVIAAQKSITKPQDLVGTTIATRVGSTGSFFVSEYLTKNGIDPAAVTVKNLDTQLLPTALCQGDIAAFFIWQPMGSRALELCPERVHYLGDGSGYMQGYNTKEGADTATRFLRALRKAKEVADNDFKAVASYARAKLDLSEKATREQWETMERPVAFDEEFYKDFCKLSRWGLRDKVTPEPLELSEFIWPIGLRTINPNLALAPPGC
jgi:NitT/TauT family transport system substrate-binding protein